MNRLDKLKNGLARVFDDNLHTKQWHNYVDYAIIALIIISTLQVFVSTFDVSKQFEHVLRWIDLITTITFTNFTTDIVKTTYQSQIVREVTNTRVSEA